MRSHYPENTLLAIQAGIDSGLYGVEIDLGLTADNQLMAVHQETLRPDNNSTKLILTERDLSSSWLSELALNEALQLDAGTWFSPSFCGIKIPTADEIFALNWKDTVMFLELYDPTYFGEKDLAMPEKLVEATFSHIDKFVDRGQQVQILSFSPDVLAVCQAEMPDVPRVWNLWKEVRKDFNNILDRACKLEVTALDIADFLILENPSLASDCRAAGFDSFAYATTPDGPCKLANWTSSSRLLVWKQLADLGVSTAISDFPLDLLSK